MAQQGAILTKRLEIQLQKIKHIWNAIGILCMGVDLCFGDHGGAISDCW